MQIRERGRGKIKWLDTVVDGVRIQRSLGTTDIREAKRRAKEIIADAQHGKITSSGMNFAKLKFGDACEKLLEQRKLTVALTTYERDTQDAARLRDFFQDKRLNEITADMVHEYRQRRAAADRKNSTINGEVGFLRLLLKKARLWHRIEDEIKPLKEDYSIGRALSDDELNQLLTKAAERSSWQSAHDAAFIGAYTGMRGVEVKHLRWCDINMNSCVLFIPKSKTKKGQRSVPLVDEAMAILRDIRRRAELHGEVLSTHYVFAAHRTGAVFNGNKVVRWQQTSFDPTRPMKSWRTAWRNMTRAAGLPGLRYHDLRHTAITKMLEAGYPESVIMDIVGHVDRRMLERYSHIRHEAKRAAMSALKQSAPDAKRDALTPNPTSDVTSEPDGFNPGVTRGSDSESGAEGYVTNRVTAGDEVPVYSDLTPLSSVEKMDGRYWTRTSDPCRVNADTPCMGVSAVV